MARDNEQFNNNIDNNPTERPGYSTTQQKYPDRMFSAEDEKKKPKSRMGLGILIGILIMIAVYVGLILLSGAGRFIGSGNASVDLEYQEKVDLINRYLDTYYMGEIDPEEYENSIAEGVLKGIGDPYADYYSPEEYAALLESISGNYAGIGVSIALNEDGYMEVFKVFEGTPAEEAGLKVGDYIIGVAGDKKFETVDDLVALVRGEEGTTVDITVKRKDEELDFNIERRNIEIPSVYHTILDDNIGYIAISKFDIATVNQFDEALTELETKGVKGLIMDLRDNPGGDYSSVVQISDRVLPEGVIISTKDKDGNIKSENSDEAHKLTLPCVVLVNENSASATELFTGALQDYGLATVVGTVTYGKGVVQSIYSFPDGSGIKFTTETYYTPKGRDINGVGIIPDVEVKLPDDAFDDGVLDEEEDTQLKKAIEILNKGE